MRDNIAEWLLLANKAESTFESKTYKLDSNIIPTLKFPTTCSIRPIKQDPEHLHDIENPNSDDTVLPHLQIHRTFDNGFVTVTISNDIERTRSEYNLSTHRAKEIITRFDGINNNRTAIFCLGDRLNFILYTLHHGLPNQDLVSDEAKNNAQLMINDRKAFPEAISLYPDQDRVIYSYTHFDKFNCGHPCLRILDIGNSTASIDFRRRASNFFIKILPCGNTKFGRENNLGEIHLGLTSFGKLIFFWLNEKNILTYAAQKHSTIFSDIAVDHTKKYGDLKYKFAFLDNKKNLFFTDLLRPGSPKLVYRHTIDATEHSGFYYENGLCSVITGNIFYTFPDNSNAYYASHELKNIDLEAALYDNNTESLTTNANL